MSKDLSLKKGILWNRLLFIPGGRLYNATFFSNTVVSRVTKEIVCLWLSCCRERSRISCKVGKWKCERRDGKKVKNHFRWKLLIFTIILTTFGKITRRVVLVRYLILCGKINILKVYWVDISSQENNTDCLVRTIKKGTKFSRHYPLFTMYKPGSDTV